MSWRQAKCLIVLKDEINKQFPNRDKESDGAIGNEEHQARESDHNPDENDVVKAQDFDEDLLGPDNPVGQEKMAEICAYLVKISKEGDLRINYIIYEKMIYSRVRNFEPKEYTGSNEHKHHMHVSCSPLPYVYDSIAPWDIAELFKNTPQKETEIDMFIYTVKDKGTFLFDGDGSVGLDQNALSELKRFGIRDVGETNADFHNWAVKAAEGKLNAGVIQ